MRVGQLVVQHVSTPLATQQLHNIYNKLEYWKNIYNKNVQAIIGRLSS